MDVERRLIIMRRVMGAVGTVILEILKWILRIILGALKLVLGLARIIESLSSATSAIIEDPDKQGAKKKAAWCDL